MQDIRNNLFHMLISDISVLNWTCAV